MLITKVRFLKSTAPLLLWFFGLVSAFGQRMESDATITPGEGIGRIFLGQKLDEVHASIGAPKLFDAAMGGRLWEIWRSGPAFDGKQQNGSEELEIYSRPEQPDLGGLSVVRQIRVTSPFFRTPSGISIRSSFSEIVGSFPNHHVDEELTYGLNGGRSEKDIEYVRRSVAWDRLRVSRRCICGSYCNRLLPGDPCLRPGTDPRVMETFDRQ
jgi:hypothetical protein